MVECLFRNYVTVGSIPVAVAYLYILLWLLHFFVNFFSLVIYQDNSLKESDGNTDSVEGTETSI